MSVFDIRILYEKKNLFTIKKYGKRIDSVSIIIGFYSLHPREQDAQLLYVQNNKEIKIFVVPVSPKYAKGVLERFKDAV